jgi:hypothetical protein
MLKFFGTGLVLLTLAVAGGCHTTNSCYNPCSSCPGQPVVTRSVVVTPGCNTCNTPPAPVAPTAVVVPGNGH